jgi:hypothetical protein
MADQPKQNSTTIRPIRLWAAVDSKGRFSLSCLYPSLEDAQSDRDVLVREHGWRIVQVRVVENHD